MPSGHSVLTDVHVYADDVDWPGRCLSTFFGRIRCAANEGHDGPHRSDDIVVWGPGL